MERIILNRSATLRKTFYADGVPADPTGSPTVAVVRQSDGTSVTTGAVTDETEAGTWSVTIPATSNTLLDSLTVTWTATVNAVAQQYVDVVEVAGDTLFNIAELQAVLPASKTTQALTVAQIVAQRTLAEQALEDACGVAFVPRYRRETVDGPCGPDLMLSMPRVRRVRSVSVSGTAWAQATIDALTFRPGGVVHSTTRWPAGYGNLTVGYEHGYDTPPERVRQAALLLAKQWIMSSPIDSRATSMSNDDGTFALMTPGIRGAVFGIPEVEATIQQYSLATGVA